MTYQKILFNGKKNAIWGAGNNCVNVLINMINQGVYIDCICDIDEKKIGICIWNKEVVHPDRILREKHEWNVIIGTTNREFERQIIEKLEGAEIRDYVPARKINPLLYGFNINPSIIWRFVKDAKEKRHILFGDNLESDKIIHIAELLDISISYKVTDCYDDCLENNSKDVYDLLDENREEIIVIIPDKDNREVLRKKEILDNLGLQEKLNYFVWDYYSYCNDNKYILDPCLGYTYVDKGLSGISLFGELNARLKIAIVGGSTSDATRFVYKCWGEYLFDLLSNKGYDICVINAGCSGYNSSQELVKIIRDVILFEPDIVISYSGVNDRRHYDGRDDLDNYPFLNHYQYDIAVKSAGMIKYERLNDNLEAYSLGVGGLETRSERYKRNIHMMKAICESYNIKFYGFLQPFLGTIDSFTKDELELIVSTQIDECKIKNDDFYSQLLRDSNPQFIDLTRMFEGEENIYIDNCHVSEKGNWIIANKILEIIEEDIKCIY